MPKKAKIEPSDDLVRETLLKYLYDIYKNPRGMESHKLKVSKIYSDLKKKGIEKKYVIRNLIYLIETSWVIEEIKTIPFNTGRRNIPTERKTYSISKNGIDFFEGNSKFQKSNNFAGINISNMSNSIVVMGDNNVVRNEYRDLSEILDKLGAQIRINSTLNDNEKLDYQSEVNTIKSQLAKEKPEKTIIQKAWEGLKAVATIDGIAGLYIKLQPLINKLIGIE